MQSQLAVFLIRKGKCWSAQRRQHRRWSPIAFWRGK